MVLALRYCTFDACVGVFAAAAAAVLIVHIFTFHICHTDFVFEPVAHVCMIAVCMINYRSNDCKYIVAPVFLFYSQFLLTNHKKSI